MTEPINEIIKIDIGSGVAKRSGYLTLDYDQKVGADIHLDIENCQHSTILYEAKRIVTGDPHAWNGFAISEIRAHHILEHIRSEYKIRVMQTFMETLKPGGILDIEVPLFPHPASVQDPTHISFWAKASFWYFIKDNKFGEAFAKRYSRGAVPLFEFVEDWERGKEGDIWAYGIKLRKPTV